MKPIITKPKELKKHVGAVHSANKLGLTQRKMINVLLHNAYSELLTKDEHSINIATLCREMHYNSNDYRLIKDAFKELLTTVIEWNLIDNSEQVKWRAATLIYVAKIDGSTCTYAFSKDIKELFYNPQMYARINMLVMAKFKSNYGLILYENCIRYQDVGQTPWIDLNLFRKIMGLEDNVYPKFKNLKQRVIEPAIKEISKYSPVNVTFEIQKEKRAVKRIQFQIDKIDLDDYRNEQKVPGLTECIISSEKKYNFTITLEQDFGCSKAQINKLRKQYEEPYIMDKIELIRNSPSFQEGKIKCLAKYLKKALEDDFQPPKASEDLKTFSTKQQEKLAKLHSRYKADYDIYLNKGLWELYQNLPVEPKAKIDMKFGLYAKTQSYYQLYLSHALNDQLVKSHFIGFLKMYQPELLQKLHSIDTFCTALMV